MTEAVDTTPWPELLTPAQAASRLGVSYAAIARRIASGDLHAIKVGSQHKITLREFERFRDERMATMIRATSAEIEADLHGA